MGDGRHNSGIHVKLALLCFLTAGAALAEEITPSFSDEAMQYEITWEIDDWLITFTANCRFSPLDSGLGNREIELSDESRWDYYRAICALSFYASPLLEIKLFGIDMQSARLDRNEAYDETLKTIHDNLMNRRPIAAALETWNLRKSDRKYHWLRPSEDYIAGIKNFIELVEQENIEAADAAEWRRIREKFWAIAQIILAALGLVTLFAIYRNGIIQRGFSVFSSRIQSTFRASSDSAASVIKSSKRKILERKRLSAAKELVVWSQLRDKGHITEEEFEKKKRELMG